MGSQPWSASGYFANLTNGVSQQPPRVRLESQQDEAINMFPTTFHQMGHRGPLEIVSKLTGLDSWLNIGANGYPYEHEYTRDSSESYNIFFDGVGGIRVHNRNDGTTRTVHITAADSYATAANPETNFHCLTYKDVTFVTNKTINVAMAATLSTTRTPEALIHVKDYVSGATYAVTVNIGGTVYGPVAPTGTDVNAIATSIKTLLTAIAGFSTGTTCTVFGNVVWISNANLNSVKVSDNRAATAIASYKDTIINTSKLPPYGPDGYLIKVTGSTTTTGAQDKNTSDDQYYRFTADDGIGTSGTWVETRAPGIKYTIDAATAPHTLTRNADGTFTWDVIPWGTRDVGDLSTNPDPVFIGQKIWCSHLLGNRLGFFAGNQFNYSRVGEDSYYQFFRKTTAATLDDDPLYGTIPSAQVNKSYWPVGWNGELVVFGDLVDGDVTYGSKFAQNNLNISTPTVTNVSPNCAPILSGSDLLFITESGLFSNIGSYQLDPITTLRHADSITQDYLGRYIPKNVKRMTGRAKDIVAILSTDTRQKIYLLTYSKKQNQLVQQAVVTWDFSSIPGMTILDIAFDSNWLYITYIGPDGFIYAGRIDVSIGAQDANFAYKCYLDHRMTVTGGTYNAGTNRTTFTLPYTATAGDLRVVVASIGVGELRYAVGTGVTIASQPTHTSFTLTGDYSTAGISLMVGYGFTRYFVPNPIYTKASTATGQRLVNTLTKVNLSRVALGFFNTQHIKIEMISSTTGRVIANREFNAGLQLDNINAKLDDNRTTFNGVLLLDGMGSATDDSYLKVSSDSHLPFFVDMIQWLASEYTAEI